MMNKQTYVTNEDEILIVEDISFVGKMDKHINHGTGAGNANITHFFLVIIGGQKIEISANDKEKTELERQQLLSYLIGE